MLYITTTMQQDQNSIGGLKLNKIKEILITLAFVFLGIPAICYIALLFNPDNKLAEAVIGILSIIWSVFKQFELHDLLRDVGLFLIIVGILTGFGVHISGRTEAKIWAIVSLIGGIIALATGNMI